MAPWPFGGRGGLTVEPYASEDPRICAHQAVRLKMLLTEFEGRYEETWVILNRLEIVYISAGRRDDADRVHADKLALAAPHCSDNYGQGIIGRLLWSWQVWKVESRYRHGQMVIEQHLADLHRRAPWKSGRDAAADEGES